MSALAPILEAFFTDRLGRQRDASPHTVHAYRDTFRLLLDYAHATTGKQPSQLDLADLDAALISGFLDHLEHERPTPSAPATPASPPSTPFPLRLLPRTRPRRAHPTRPGHPRQTPATAVVSFLTDAEVDALIAAPDRTTWLGRRDHALLVTAVQTGLRVSRADRAALPRRRARHRRSRALLRQRPQRTLHPAHPPHRRRAPRLDRRARPLGDQPLFPTRRGTRSTPTRSAISSTVTSPPPANTTARRWTTKTVTPHTLRHTAAMTLLAAGVDTAVIALWLGHEHTQTTQIYLHGDLTMKERALARTTPPAATRPLPAPRPPPRLPRSPLIMPTKQA